LSLPAAYMLVNTVIALGMKAWDFYRLEQTLLLVLSLMLLGIAAGVLTTLRRSWRLAGDKH